MIQKLECVSVTNLDTCKKVAVLLWKRPWQLQITKEGNRQVLLRIINCSLIFQFVLPNFYLGQQRQTLMIYHLRSKWLAEAWRAPHCFKQSFVAAQCGSSHLRNTAACDLHFSLLSCFGRTGCEANSSNAMPAQTAKQKECLYKPLLKHTDERKALPPNHTNLQKRVFLMQKYKEKKKTKQKQPPKNPYTKPSHNF